MFLGITNIYVTDGKKTHKGTHICTTVANQTYKPCFDDINVRILVFTSITAVQDLYLSEKHHRE